MESRILLLSLLALVVPSAVQVGAGPTGDTKKAPRCGPARFRMPTDRIRPTHYELLVNPDADAMTFEGSVGIYLNVTRTESDFRTLKSNQMLLNADKEHVQIEETSIKYMDASGKSIEVVGFCQDNKFGNIVLTFAEDLVAGSSGKLSMNFAGKIRNDSNGLFRDDSYTVDGKMSRLLLTQFEPALARQMFPCFDEPDFKATFEVTVVHPDHETALSNTELVSSTKDKSYPKKLVSRFAKTPIMSTYLVAIVIGQFDFVEQLTSDGKVTVRVYTPPGRAEEGRNSLELAVRTMDLLHDYFQVEYPISKIDFVSSPSFAFGGMENYGLVVYEDRSLLVTNMTELYFQQYSRETVVHELVHQWIGNLVTLKWWDETWLNEGFTQWLGTYLAHQLDRRYEHDLLSRGEEGLTSLEEDLKVIIVPPSIKTADDIERAFGANNYIKGSMIVQMLHDYIGPETFKAAMREYVRANKHSNVQVVDLVDVMERHSGSPVAEFLNTWLNTSGHPLFRVEYKKIDNVLVIKETKYGTKKSEHWTTPINVLVSGDDGRQETIKFLLDEPVTEVKLPQWFDVDGAGHFVKVNPSAIGFFHVKYSDRLLAKLMESIQSLSLMDKIELLRSTKSLMEMRELGPSKVLAMFKALDQEEDPILVDLMYDYAVTPRLRSYVDSIGHKLIEEHGVLAPKHLGVAHQRAYARLVSKFIRDGYQPAIDQALAAFDGDFDEYNSDARVPILSAVVNHGTDDQFEALLNFAYASNKFDEKMHLYDASLETLEEDRLSLAIHNLVNDPFPFANKAKLLTYARQKLEQLERADVSE